MVLKEGRKKQIYINLENELDKVGKNQKYGRRAEFFYKLYDDKDPYNCVLELTFYPAWDGEFGLRCTLPFSMSRINTHFTDYEDSRAFERIKKAVINDIKRKDATTYFQYDLNDFYKDFYSMTQEERDEFYEDCKEEYLETVEDMLDEIGNICQDWVETNL